MKRSVAWHLQLAMAVYIKRRAEDTGAHTRQVEVLADLHVQQEEKRVITKSLHPSPYSATPIFYGFVNE